MPHSKLKTVRPIIDHNGHFKSVGGVSQVKLYSFYVSDIFFNVKVK